MEALGIITAVSIYGPLILGLFLFITLLCLISLTIDVARIRAILKAGQGSEAIAPKQ